MDCKLKWVEFFIGFIEGDGSIQVNHSKKKYLQFRILIKLKKTESNYRMLKNLRDNLGIMNLHIRKNWVILVEDDKKKLLKCIKVINSISESNSKSIYKNSLYSKFFISSKKEQYVFFCYCLEKKIKYSEYLYLKENKFILIQNNKFIDKMNLNEYPNWLCGFIQAQGCFSIRKNGNHSFSIGQLDSLNIIKAIKVFFNLPNKIREIKSLSNKEKIFYSIETYNKISLDKISSFLNNSNSIGLLGSKKDQFIQFQEVMSKKCRG